MIVTDPTRARLGGTIEPADFADIAPCLDISWATDGALELTFDRDLTAAEEAIVRLRCQSGSPVEVTLRQQALTAMQANRDFLALTTPTAADITKQAKALTRQMQALIRLALGAFDGTD